MKTVHWGILGCGKVCEKKAGPALYGVDHSSLVAVMRRDAEKARDFAARHAVPRWYADQDKLLADSEVEYVYVATPDAAHHAGTLAALRAGKHVLVEKAMASNTQQCDEMIAEARERNLILAVAYYRRGYPTILRAKELIDSGAIGELREIHINDEFPLSHRLDLLHFFAGDIQSVEARTVDLPPCSARTRGVMLECRHHTGVTSQTPFDWDENLVPETLDIRGSDGRIIIHDLKAGLLVTNINGKKTREDLGPLPATHWGLIDNFVKHVNGLAPLACDGVEGRKSTVILDLVAAITPDTGPAAVSYHS